MCHPSQISPSAAAAASAPVAPVTFLGRVLECHVQVVDDLLVVRVGQLVQLPVGFVQVLMVDVVSVLELNHQRGTGLMLKEYRMVDFPRNPCLSC